VSEIYGGRWAAEGGDGGKNAGLKKYGKATHRNVGRTIGKGQSYGAMLIAEDRSAWRYWTPRTSSIVA